MYFSHVTHRFDVRPPPRTDWIGDPPSGPSPETGLVVVDGRVRFRFRTLYEGRAFRTQHKFPLGASPRAQYRPLACNARLVIFNRVRNVFVPSEMSKSDRIFFALSSRSCPINNEYNTAERSRSAKLSNKQRRFHISVRRDTLDTDVRT